jgi:uncharacterized YccA/Bax inhibitor family protein
MRSNNPVFSRSEEFNGTVTTDPSTWSTGSPTTVVDSRMTIDSVVQKTAISLGIVIVTAALTWMYIGEVATGTTLASQENYTQLMTALLVGSGGAFALSMVNSFKRVISPALVLIFSAFEGVALGALSKFFETYFGDGIVVQAVIGTFAAFAGTLATYRFFEIKVGNRFRTFVIAAMFGMVGLGLLELVLGAFGNAIGIFGFGGLGLLFAVAGLVLGIFMLILDFDFVENGVRAGLPERESWRAAFALTVSLVWIYTNLLRILAIMRGD